MMENIYENYINKYNPKPIFNLDFYTNNDLYSDGDVENIIVDIIANNDSEDYTEAIAKNYSWPVYYHLTRTRKNLLNWYNFDKKGDVLEIGCGFGALTSLLCDKCNTVTAVELSKRRAIGALLRCRNRDNLEIIVGNLNDIVFHQKYDYITLIGVLEYQGLYTESGNPYRDFLKKIKSLLKPNGKLLIAIENQYGLKYWCGAKEDHTGVPFDGINQYKFADKGVRTFSKEVLKELISESGFKNSYFYYPMPDYKLPTVVYSQDYLPKDENMFNTDFYYVPDSSSLIALERDLYKDIINNKVFEFFANSYLVECSDDDNLGQIIFASLCNERIEEYQLGTKILRNKEVNKFSLSEKGMAHIVQTVRNEKALADRGLYTLGSKINEFDLVVPYSEEENFENIFVAACRSGDEEKAIFLLEKLYAEIMKSSDIVADEENILYVLRPDMKDEKIDYGPILKYGYMDMIFRNAFVVEDQLVWFDQEWMLENIPADYIIYRALGTVYFSYPDINNTVPMERIIEKCGLKDSWKGFGEIEKFFVLSISDQKHIKEGAVYTQTSSKIVIQNIQKVMK